MTQCTTMAAPDSIEPYTLAMSLAADDPSVVLALIAEIEDIFESAAPAPVCERPAPPVVGCAPRGPWRAGWPLPSSTRPHIEPVQRVDPVQRSPPRRQSAPQTRRPY